LTSPGNIQARFASFTTFRFAQKELKSFHETRFTGSEYIYIAIAALADGAAYSVSPDILAGFKGPLHSRGEREE